MLIILFYSVVVNGYKEEVNISRCSKDEIAQWIGLMKGRAGTQIVRLRKEWHTDNPSIQGIWHPFMFKDTAVNVTDKRDRSLSEHVSHFKSATQKVQEMFEHQRQQEKLSGQQSNNTRTDHYDSDVDQVQKLGASN